MIKFLFQFICI